ncbi:MAG: rhodanese-like domain-containing protein [Thermoleophilaceae bacterium]|nr:rhodanese-like domain-containing protein [Thermoleophilaceae bacterium]
MTFDPRQWELDPERVAELAARGEVVVVDVREPYEHEAGRIAGALHVPLDRLAEAAGELAGERPLVFHCRVGARSALAAQAFRAAGVEAFNMTGGLVEWVERGLPLEPDGGRVAEH